MFTKITEQRFKNYISEERSRFKGTLYGSLSDLKKDLLSKFESAIAEGPEESIQRVITDNPYLINYVFPDTGHHGVWVFPKRMIRSQQANGTPGLIPDYLVVAKNSLGYTWQIVELKRRDTQFSNANGKSFSSAGQKSIVQAATYITDFSQYIETIRSNVGIQEIIQPQNIIIVIGDSRMETQEQKARRSEFEHLAPRVKVSTYDRIRRGLENDLRFKP